MTKKISLAVLFFSLLAAPSRGDTEFPYRAIAQMSKEPPQTAAASDDIDPKRVAFAIRGIATGANPPAFHGSGTRKALDGSKVPKEVQFGTPSGK